MFANKMRAEGTLTLDGTEYGLRINMNTFRLANQMFGIDLNSTDAALQKDQIGFLSSLAYCAAKTEARKNKQKFDMDFEDFCDILLDDATNLNVVLELMNEAFTGPEEGNTEESGNA